MTPNPGEGRQHRVRPRRPSLPDISEILRQPLQRLPSLRMEADVGRNLVVQPSSSDGLKSFAFNKNIRRRHSIHRFGLTQKTPRTLQPLKGSADGQQYPATRTSSAATSGVESHKG